MQTTPQRRHQDPDDIEIRQNWMRHDLLIELVAYRDHVLEGLMVETIVTSSAVPDRRLPQHVESRPM